MRLSLPLVAVCALPLAACGISPYGYGYGNNYNPLYGSIGSLGGAYGSSFSQAAVNACGNYASRYGRVSIRNVERLSNSSLKVAGTVSNGYRNEGWDCTYRSDGRITDFDL